MITKVILKIFKVKVRSHKVANLKSQACRTTHVMWVVLHIDIDSDAHLTPMTASNSTFDECQVKLWSSKAKFQINIF